MTIRDKQLIDVLLCVADICLANPHSTKEAGAAISIACEGLPEENDIWHKAYNEIEREFPINGVQHMSHTEFSGDYTTKGIAALRAAIRIEEVRGVLR